ncbi:hypothetical protein LK422_09665 [Blautia massiliensis (ex Durand et al. 2017)]|uniref:hypothetical protein n=1 Tax=Blautia TaxID=572511 RepID=UPI0003968CA7|nr:MULTISPECIES: hypothetical protein [Blautia]ERI98203.1 hypothetical protein HMPREF1547_00112 [Blautia sp. KLE 1732]UEA27392.1 hypothetical protein LK422_09665 [Blautia massiliensis (ex Durand et al. 2017)]UWO15776.1 hypothetical protein NQ489_10655 [Blautia sp. KLE_1732_HM_1032]
MSKTWENRALSKSKVALVEMQRQLEIISKDVEQASKKNQLDLLQKIDIIEDWYALYHIVCKEHNFECKDCPFIETATEEWDSDTNSYETYYDCKFEFGSGYAGDIIPYIEKYREKIDRYKKKEDEEQIYTSRGWHKRYQ